MKSIMVTMVFLSIGLASASDYERWDLPRRQKTIEREEKGEIKTVWPDLRIGGLDIHPAMPLPTWGGMATILYEQEDKYRNNLTENREGRTKSYGARLEQSLWSWGWVEFEGRGLRSEFDRVDNVSDLESVLVFAPYRDRYTALAFELGTQVSVADGSDIDYNHNHTFNTPTYIIGSRFGFVVGFCCITLNARGLANFAGHTVTQAPRTTDDGAVIPAGDWNNRFVGGDFGGTISYRLLRQLRIGVEGRFVIKTWKGIEDGDTARIRDYGLPCMGYLEITPIAWWLLRAGVGYDPIDPLAKDQIHGWDDVNAHFSTTLVW
jgi:hypothetical protein